MNPRLQRRARQAVPSAVLAVTIYLPLLLTRVGRVGADTKTYLYLDPSKMLARASSMWDPNIGMGTVTHQNIGYLWPIGPWYWAFQNLGAPDWVAQRLWLGTILFAAGLGVRFMLKAFGQEGPHVTAATFCYALTPYTLSLAARLSVILLPYAGLPWLIGLTVLALRRGGWRYPALFALVVATIGSINATALILVGVGPLLLILHEVVIVRDVAFLDAAKAVGRIGLLTVGCSLWWMAGLWSQGSYGIDILRFTETAETVATASLSLEVLRGLGYWFFYGEDRFGPWIAPSRAFTSRVGLLLATFVLPGLGLLGAAVTRFRDRVFFLLLLVVGLFLAVGAHPWDDPPPAGRAVKAFLLSDVGLSMRSLPRAAPLVVLATSVFVGSLVASISRERERLARPLTAAVMVLAVLALPPLWRGQFVDVNLDRPEAIPSYWRDAAAALDRRDVGTRVLEVPGQDFASYRWGTTVDPILPGLMDRPYVARELIPYGSPPSADLLNAFDHRLQEQTYDRASLAPIARFMGVGDVSVRADVAYERYNTPRPRLLWDELTGSPGVGSPTGFGGTARNIPRPSLPLLDEQELLTPPSLPDPPQVGVLPITDPEKIIRTAPVDGPVILAGDGDGLVDAAGAGLLNGHELVTYAGTWDRDRAGLDRQLNRDAALILTDTNRRQARRWGTVRDATGITERAGQEPMRLDLKDQRLALFGDEDTQDAAIEGAGAGDDAATVTESRGGVWAEATSYGNAVSLTPEDNPVNAVDAKTGTAWRVGGFSSAVDETLRIHYRKPVTTDALRILQAQGGVRNRFITGVDVRFDGGPPLRYQLGASSRDARPGDRTPGQSLRFARRSFSTVAITITETDPGRLRRYDGVSAVGFAEVVPDVATPPVADDVIRLPTDLLRATGRRSIDHALAVVLTRQRVAGTVAVRSDPEPSMDRTFDLPAGRSFTLSGQVHLSNAAADDVVDAALGRRPASDGGVTATSGRRMPGDLAGGASAAIDGDPDTWYSPGFLGQQGEHLDYTLAKPITFDRLALTVLNDGRHSVPRQLRIDVDGRIQTVDVPAIDDAPTPNAHRSVDLRLDRPLTGRHITVTIPRSPSAVRDVTTLDWFTGRPIVMPVGIVELGIDGLRSDPIPTAVRNACRRDLLQVNGRAVGVQLQGRTTDLTADRPVELTSCDGEALRLPTGSITLRSTPGSVSGFDLDRLVLRSAPGGAADPSSGTISPVSASRDRRPKLRIERQGRTSTDVRVARAPRPFWLVLGQSHNRGWHAQVDGRDLGEPTLVNGYANGWIVPAGTDLRIHLEWTPQKVVWSMIALSVFAVIASLALIAWPRRRTSAGEADAEIDTTRVPLDARAAMPRAFNRDRVLHYAGPTPGTFASITTVVGALAIGGVVIGPIAGVSLAVVALLALRWANSRPLLTLGGPALFAASVLWMAWNQYRLHLPSGFDWPTYFEVLQQPAWTAVALLLLDAVADRCWLRRWWPTDSSPE